MSRYINQKWDKFRHCYRVNELNCCCNLISYDSRQVCAFKNTVIASYFYLILQFTILMGFPTMYLRNKLYKKYTHCFWGAYPQDYAHIEVACHDYDMARSDYGTVCHENLFKFTQTTSGCDVAIGAPLITWHAPAVSLPFDSPRASIVSSTNILPLTSIYNFILLIPSIHSFTMLLLLESLVMLCTKSLILL